jgi:hypothetical protein
MLGIPIGSGFLPLAAILAGITLILTMIWALVTWSADRYIAQARVSGETD